MKTNIEISKVRAQFDEAGLTLAAHKTETVLISGLKIVEKVEVTVRGTRIERKRAIKYLRVIIEDRLNFKKHVIFIGEKASVTQGEPTRVIPNIEEPNLFKKTIISRVVMPIMLYVCLICWDAFSVETTSGKLSSVYRLSAIREISGFRTMSDEAVLVLGKAILLDILADKKSRIYFRRLECPEQIAAIKAVRSRR